MDIVWTWWGVPGTFGLVAGCCCAIVVLRTAPKRALNRRLSLIMLFEGIFIACHMGLLFFFDNHTIVTALVIVGMATRFALLFQYLAFLAIALDTPLVVPFRTPVARNILNAASVLVAIFVFTNPGLFVSELYSPSWAPWNFQFIDMGLWAIQLWGAVYLFGLIAALSAFFRAEKGSAARNQAMWFAIAFGFRDIFAGIVQILYPILRPVPFWGDFIYNPGQAIVFSVYFLLLAYGVLRWQLFDIDLKVKIVLRQSTVVAMIAGGFIVVSETLESLIPVNGVILSIAIAVLILIVLRPIHRFALGVTNRMMSGVQNTPEYLDSRKIAVYRATLEGAVEDGIVTEMERRLLERLRVELSISLEDATAIENEFRQ